MTLNELERPVAINTHNFAQNGSPGSLLFGNISFVGTTRALLVSGSWASCYMSCGATR